MKKSLFFTYVLLIVPMFALIGKTPDSLKTRDNYIGRTDTLINVKINGNNNYQWFNLSGTNPDSTTFEYDLRPNISIAHKVSVSYRLISFSFGFKLPFIPGNDDNDIKGKTKSFSLGMEILGDHFIQKVNYSKTKGYYLNNTEDFKGDNWEPSGNDPYITIPDLKTIEYSGYSGYKFNENFSIKAITNQSEIQLKSCGSFIMLLNYRYLIVDDKSNDYDQNSSQRSRNLYGTFNAGYLYSLIINKHFYISAGVIPGYGIKYTDLLTRFPTENYKSNYTDQIFELNLRSGIGYNSRTFFAGYEISGIIDQSKQSRTDVTLNNERLYMQVFVGYRFGAPKIVNKQMDIMEEQMHEQMDKLKK